MLESETDLFVCRNIEAINFRENNVEVSMILWWEKGGSKASTHKLSFELVRKAPSASLRMNKGKREKERIISELRRN